MPANTPRGYPYPLYTDPADFPAQSQAFATAVDTDVQAQVASTADALYSPSAWVSASANQAIGSATATLLTFATEDYDNAAMANLGVNNERLTITETGFYLVSAWVLFAASGASGGRRMVLTSSATGDIAWDSRIGSTTEIVEISITSGVYATAGTFIRVVVEQTTLGSVNAQNRGLTATKVAD